MRLPWLAWALVAWVVLAGLARAASCEPHVSRWADMSEGRAVAYEWRWAPEPTMAPSSWGQPAWQALDGPDPEAWEHCWRGGVDPPGAGWIEVRALGADGLVSAWSNPKPVPEPPAMLGVGLGVLAFAAYRQRTGRCVQNLRIPSENS